MLTDRALCLIASCFIHLSSSQLKSFCLRLYQILCWVYLFVYTVDRWFDYSAIMSSSQCGSPPCPLGDYTSLPYGFDRMIYFVHWNVNWSDMCHFWMIASRVVVCLNRIYVFCHRQPMSQLEDDSSTCVLEKRRCGGKLQPTSDGHTEWKQNKPP